MPLAEPGVLRTPALGLPDETVPVLVQGQERAPSPLSLLGCQQVQQRVLRMGARVA